jgi:hypothetical protein
VKRLKVIGAEMMLEAMKAADTEAAEVIIDGEVAGVGGGVAGRTRRSSVRWRSSARSTSMLDVDDGGSRWMHDWASSKAATRRNWRAC